MHHRLNNSLIGLYSVFGHDVSVYTSTSEQSKWMSVFVFVWKDHVKAVKICQSVSSFPNGSWTQRVRSDVALEMLNPIWTRSICSNRNPSSLMFSSKGIKSLLSVRFGPFFYLYSTFMCKGMKLLQKWFDSFPENEDQIMCWVSNTLEEPRLLEKKNHKPPRDTNATFILQVWMIKSDFLCGFVHIIM